ncbi:MAG TPA: site-specific integrase [Steroidobacteraceae bacterium]|nr:site-specific integrase [Steroidobacteraceae bacterium]
MGRSATGSVRFVRGKWIAYVRREYLGSFDSQQEAQDTVNASLRIDSDRAPDSLRVWGERWMDERELGGDTRGIDQERSVWDQHIATAAFYDWPLRKVRPADVQKWLVAVSQKESIVVTRRKVGGEWVIERKRSGHRVSRQTVVHARRLLTGCYRAACVAGKVSQNPVHEVITPKMATVTEDDESWTFLLAGEIDKLFASIAEARRAAFYRAWYSVAIYGGLRLEEIKGLRWEDVRDGELRVRRCARGGRTAPLKERSSRRNVPMLRPLREALHVWQRTGGAVKARGLVFPSDHGSPYGDSYDASWETQWRRKSGCRPSVRHHDLRHTCGSHLVMGTWGRAFELHEVRDWLGHSDVQTTQRYAHLAPGALHAVVREMEQQKPNRKEWEQ